MVKYAFLRMLLVVFGIISIIYYSMETPQCKGCCYLWEIGEHENITYSLRKTEAKPSLIQNFSSVVDYDSLIDMSFAFTIRNYVCDSITPLLLILVHSAPKNFKKRKVIRETWGKNTDDVKILFVLGITNDKLTAIKLKNENHINKDLLQGSFLDSYRNLTYKHTMCLKYVVYHCPQAKYVLKLDDDTCVNLPFFKNFLIRDLSPHGAQNLLMCNVINKSKVSRGYRSKWRVSFDDYHYRYFPPYCVGWYILYSPDLIFKLYREVQRSKYFWIDDVHITGIIPKKLKLSVHTDVSALTLSRSDIKSLHYDPPRKCRRFLVGRANMDAHEIRHMWKYIVNSPVPTSIREN